MNVYLILNTLIYFLSVLSQEYHVRDFNATGNGIVDDTHAVRSALLAASNTNGGRVIFDAGSTFLTGCFNVTSNIILDVRGTILGSNDTNNFVLVQPVPWFGGGPDAQMSGQMEWQSIIRSYNADNITITGGGTIDGQGKYWWPCQENLTNPPCNNYSRPPLIRLVDTTNIEINHVILQNSPSWTLHLANTTDVHVNNISILAPLERRHSDGWFLAVNTDGFDIDCSKNVLIENCRYSAGDDAVAVKAGMNYLGRTFGRTTENVLVRNLTVGPGCGGLSIGSEMSGGVRNVTFQDVTVKDTVLGIFLKSERGRGGTIQDITYNNIYMDNVTLGIQMSMNYHPNLNVTNSTGTPNMKNIYLTNIVYVSPPSHGEAWRLDGLPESPIENLVLKNITIANNTHTMLQRCDNVFGSCDNSSVYPYCPPCVVQQSKTTTPVTNLGQSKGLSKADHMKFSNGPIPNTNTSAYPVDSLSFQCCVQGFDNYYNQKPKIEIEYNNLQFTISLISLWGTFWSGIFGLCFVIYLSTLMISVKTLRNAFGFLIICQIISDGFYFAEVFIIGNSPVATTLNKFILAQNSTFYDIFIICEENCLFYDIATYIQSSTNIITTIMRTLRPAYRLLIMVFVTQIDFKNRLPKKITIIICLLVFGLTLMIMFVIAFFMGCITLRGQSSQQCIIYRIIFIGFKGFLAMCCFILDTACLIRFITIACRNNTSRNKRRKEALLLFQSFCSLFACICSLAPSIISYIIGYQTSTWQLKSILNLSSNYPFCTTFGSCFDECMIAYTQTRSALYDKKKNPRSRVLKLIIYIEDKVCCCCKSKKNTILPVEQILNQHINLRIQNPHAPSFQSRNIHNLQGNIPVSHTENFSSMPPGVIDSSYLGNRRVDQGSLQNYFEGSSQNNLEVVHPNTVSIHHSGNLFKK